LIGGQWRWLGEIREREKFSREGGRSSASVFSCFPRCQAANDKRRDLRIPGLYREIPQQILFSPFGRFERGRKEREKGLSKG
jgi:hypothetical protein